VMSMSVCLFVCPLVQLKKYMGQTSPIFVHVAYGPGSPATRYILPVLWMALSCHTMGGPMAHRVYSKVAIEHEKHIAAEIPTKFCSTTKINKCLSSVAHRGQNLLSTIILLCLLTVAAARSYFADVKIRYVLPVSQMTSCFA